jgi:hypothetical protein
LPPRALRYVLKVPYLPRIEASIHRLRLEARGTGTGKAEGKERKPTARCRETPSLHDRETPAVTRK